MYRCLDVVGSGDCSLSCRTSPQSTNTSSFSSSAHCHHPHEFIHQSFTPARHFSFRHNLLAFGCRPDPSRPTSGCYVTTFCITAIVVYRAFNPRANLDSLQSLFSNAVPTVNRGHGCPRHYRGECRGEAAEAQDPTLQVLRQTLQVG